MARLIDADAFKENMEKKYGFYARQPQDDIDAQPTVDAVPVVRCKDCIEFKPYEKPVEDFDGKCKLNIGICGEVDEDFYCQFGKRKDGEQDEKID